jgi:hypothetical protein
LKTAGLIFILIFVTTSVSVAASDLDSSTALKEIDRFICMGQHTEAENAAVKFQFSFPSAYEGTLINYFQFNDEKAIERAVLSGEEKIPDSHSARLNLFWALVVTTSTNLRFMEELLDFKSNLPSYESNRLFAKSSLHHLKGEHAKAWEVWLEAIENALVLSTAFVSGVFFLDGKMDAERPFVEKAQRLFARRTKDIINPTLARSANEYLNSGADFDDWTRYNILERAYEDCKFDMIISEAFAYELIRHHEFLRAESILSSSVQQKYPPPYSLYLYAMASEGIGNESTAKLFYERALAAPSIYLREEFRQISRERLKKLGWGWPQWNWILLVISVAVPLVLVLFIVWRKRTAIRRS